MILVIENRQTFASTTTPSPQASERSHECSLQETLRRMGFYAARAPRRRRREPPLDGSGGNGRDAR